MPESLRPRSVVIAVAIYVASLVLGIISSVLIPVPGPLWFSATIVVIMLLLALALWRRQGWSRFVLLILFLLGLPLMFAIRDLLSQRGALGAAVLVIQTMLQAISLLLVFTGEARAWYKHRASSTEPSTSGP